MIDALINITGRPVYGIVQVVPVEDNLPYVIAHIKAKMLRTMYTFNSGMEMGMIKYEHIEVIEREDYVVYRLTYDAETLLPLFPASTPIDKKDV